MRLDPVNRRWSGYQGHTGARWTPERRQRVLLLALWLVVAFPITSHLSPVSALDSRANQAVRAGLLDSSTPLGLQSDLCDFASAAATAEALNLTHAADEPTSYADDLGSLMCLFKRGDGQERTPGRLHRAGDGLFDAAAVAAEVPLVAPLATGGSVWPFVTHNSQTTPRPVPPPPRLHPREF